MQLEAEMRNSNRLGRNIEELTTAKRELLDRIDRIKSEHIEELRRLVDRPRRRFQHRNIEETSE